MKVLFDEGHEASFGVRLSETNSPAMLVKRRRDMLEKLGYFIRADIVEYKDLGKTEIFTITKGAETLVLHVSGNNYDGGWLTIEERQ